MTIRTIFNRKIVVEHCDKNYVPQSMVNQMLEWIKDERIVRIPQHINDSLAPSTCDVPDLYVTNLTDSNNLLNWIISKVIENSKEFINGDLKKVSIGRNWFNVMFKDSQGGIHNHNCETYPGTSVVAIFYVQVPKDSANLYFTDGTTIITQEAVEGNLIIHDAEIDHGVNIHNNTIPRICIVMDLILET